LSNYESYTNWDYGYTIEYPSDWYFKEESGGFFLNHSLHSYQLLPDMHVRLIIHSENITNVMNLAKLGNPTRNIDILNEFESGFFYIATYEDWEPTYGQRYYWQYLNYCYELILECFNKYYESNNSNLPQELQFIHDSFTLFK
jgi:hypothetical protein